MSPHDAWYRFEENAPLKFTGEATNFPNMLRLQLLILWETFNAIARWSMIQGNIRG